MGCLGSAGSLLINLSKMICSNGKKSSNVKTNMKNAAFFPLPWLGGLALAALAPAGWGANLIGNGGFAAGTAQWIMEGRVFDTGEAAVFSDQGGARVVLFQTAAVPIDRTQSLVLSFDFLNALSPGVPVGGTPDAFFASAFAGGAPFGSSFSGAFFEVADGVLDADFRGASNLPAGIMVSASLKGGAWIHYSLPLPVAPFVTVAFEFIDGNGVVGDSVAAVDNVVLEAALIPEPAIPAILLGVLAGTALRRRRRDGWGCPGFLCFGPPPSTHFP